MSELSSVSNPRLYRLAMIKVAAQPESDQRDYLLCLLEALNPRRLSCSDMDTLHDIVEVTWSH